MPKPAHSLERDFVSVSLQFLQRQPWRELPNDALFLLRVPTEEHPLAASIMGAACMEFGLGLACGKHAFQQFSDMLRERTDSEDLALSGDMLSVVFDPWHTLPEEFKRLLQLAGHSPRREKRVPVAFASPPYEATRPAKRAELRTLLWCLRGILGAMDAGEFEPFPLDEQQHQILELQIDGKLKRPDVSVHVVDWPMDSVEAPMFSMLPSDLAELPRLDERWLATRIQLPALIEGDDRLASGFLVAVEQGPILASQVGMGSDLGEGQTVLIQAFRAECMKSHPAGLPSEIVFGDRRLHDALSAALAGLDIQTSFDPVHPILLEMGNSLLASLGLDEQAAGEGPLHAWKTISSEVTAWLMQEVSENDLVTPRALKRYFGSLEDCERISTELEQLSPYPAFLEWLVADYRPTKRSKTLVEKLLAEGDLEPEVRQLLEARLDAVRSIFRVDSREPGASLEVEDIFTGQHYTLHDGAMSTCELDGRFVPLRLILLEDWCFPFLAGPPLSSMQIPAAVEVLEAGGGPPMPESLQREPHRLGRLWPWLLHAVPLKMLNTDGDDLEPQSACFQVADTRALLRAFEQREDMDQHDDEKGWTWFRDGTTTGFGDITVLAHITLFDDKLLLEVNSNARFERARAWIEEIDGVSFESLMLDERVPDQVPLEGRLPSAELEPLEPEVLREFEQMLHEHCRRWVDLPIPMLDNLTPRQACAKSDGRRKVAQLVRRMPPMQTPGGAIQVPREEILRDLGICE